MLRDYQLNQPGTSRQAMNDTPFVPESRSTVWAEPFRQPYIGEVNGDPVLLIQVGDKPGASDVVLCTDAEGTIRTVKLEHARITGVPAIGGTYVSLQQALASGRALQFPNRATERV